MQALGQYGLVSKQITTFLVVLLVGTVLAISFLVSGIGILRLREWARRLILGTAVAMIAAHVIQAATGLPPSAQYIALLKTVSRLIFYGLIIWFFSRASVKAQFQKLQ